ncbi:hypothetical protein EMCRGX_G011317 [Ephydatia muelleri]
MANRDDAFVGRTGTDAKPDPRLHKLCQRRLEYAVKRNPYVRYMLDAMKKAGCEVNLEKHVVCEPCGPTVSGGFDPEHRQVVLCENNIYSQGCMNDTLTHELVHAYDYCRVNIDWNNLEHLACTEARVLVTALAVCSSVSSCTRTHLRMQRMPQTNVAHPHTHIPTQLHDDTTHTHIPHIHTYTIIQCATQIRAASLSGECFFWKETFARLKFGWKAHHQVCARERAIKSILCVKNITEAEATRAVDSVFAKCFQDTIPFERVPP